MDIEQDRVDIAIYKARVSARHAGFIRQKRNPEIQKSAMRAEGRARRAIRMELLLAKLTVVQWEQQVELSREEMNRLQREERLPQNKGNRLVRLERSLAQSSHC